MTTRFGSAAAGACGGGGEMAGAALFGAGTGLGAICLKSCARNPVAQSTSRIATQAAVNRQLLRSRTITMPAPKLKNQGNTARAVALPAACTKM
jgi:hypothetical protein